MTDKTCCGSQTLAVTAAWPGVICLARRRWPRHLAGGFVGTAVTYFPVLEQDADGELD